MKSSYSITSKIYLVFTLLVIIAISSSGLIIVALNNAEDDTEFVDALGRQRMLSQSMAKSVLGFTMASNQTKVIEDKITLLNQFITQMRKVYSQTVIGPAKQAGMGITMHPGEDERSIPFPATLTRLVNAEFEQQSGLSTDIIAESPVNPEKGFKTPLDREAWNALRADPMLVYTKAVTQDNKLYIKGYAADVASGDGCVTCHTNIQGRPFKLGDMLGMRKFSILFSDNAALGAAELSPNLNEYTTASRVFAETLAAAKSGGRYPLDLKMQQYGTLATVNDKESLKIINQIEEVFKNFAQSVEVILNAKIGSNDYRNARHRVLSQSNELRKLSNDLVIRYNSLAQTNQQQIFWTAISSGVGIMLMVLGLGWFLVACVLKPIELTTAALRDISEGDGDLTQRLAITSKDEIGELSTWVNSIIENFHNIINQVVSSTVQLSTATEQMSTISEQTSKGIGNQLSETEQVATALNQMSASVQEVAHNATQASAATQQANEQAEEGQRVVQLVGVSIKELAEEVQNTEGVIRSLEKGSQDIGTVVDVIKGIAEQTNLLALNAAIEAARAGEQGRGFTVVADEVRNLASRTQESTQEIQAMIEKLQASSLDAVDAMAVGHGKAKETMTLAEQAGKSIESIASGITTINDMNTQIASAAEEQSVVAIQVDQNLVAVKDISEDAHVGARQTATASEELAKLAVELQVVVGKFKVA